MKRNFNIHDLRIFYTVVMAGSTRQAAQIMHLTQPAVSHAISRLESATGVQLFDRSYKTLRPTEAGQYLYSEAKFVLDELVRIDEALHSIEQFGGRGLRIAASPALALGYAPDAVRRYLDANGTRPFSIDIESSVQAISAVETMRADFGLGAVHRDSARLRFTPFLRADVVAIAHRDHALADAGDAEDLGRGDRAFRRLGGFSRGDAGGALHRDHRGLARHQRPRRDRGGGGRPS